MAWAHTLIKFWDFISKWSDIYAWLNVYYATSMTQNVMTCYILAGNYSNYQHQPPAVSSVASGNMLHMINPICDYYASGAFLQKASMHDVLGMQGHTGMMSLASSSNAAGIMNEYNGVVSEVMFGGDSDLLEPSNMVNSEASVPPYNGEEYNSLTFNEALPALETNSFGHSGQMSRAIGFSNCAGWFSLSNKKDPQNCKWDWV